METIRVNMTPCEDVQTIHASQNDNEAREWGFELHNNGEKIDSSSISDQLVFKAYKGGTEEILPTNGSTPTTSPFKGDIKYPQGLLSDQEFLYRESPTEEDGNAKIKSLYGNTLVWNQLIQNGNFESTSGWAFPNGTGSVSDNVLTATATGTNLQITRGSTYALTQGHKIYISCWIKSSVAKDDVRLRISQNNPLAHVQYISQNLNANVRTNISGIITAESNTTNTRFSIFILNSANGEVYTVDSFVAFDLTQMGLDITASEFTSLFPLPYYAYNQGTLLSFNGNGIKTTGKNLLETATSGSVSGVTFTVNSDGSITVNGTATSNGTYDLYRNTTVLPSWARAGETYVLSLTNIINRFDIFSYDSSGTSKSLASISGLASQTFTIPNDAVGLLVRIFVTSGVAYDVTVYPQIEFGTTPSSYEPYTSSTLSLPISTYFSNGMKSAGNVYDELTESKAITRIGRVDLGSLTWTYQSGNARFNANQALSSLAKLPSSNNEVANILCAKYATASSNNTASASYDLSVGLSTNGNIQIRDTNYTDATAFKTAMSGLYLYYELATPTETSFTTASLVTENAEIPLSNEDGTLIGKCTEELSAEPGFHDAKIKLADADGECYSNKIQLHVERSPQ